MHQTRRRRPRDQAGLGRVIPFIDLIGPSRRISKVAARLYILNKVIHLIDLCRIPVMDNLLGMGQETRLLLLRLNLLALLLLPLLLKAILLRLTTIRSSTMPRKGITRIPVISSNLCKVDSLNSLCKAAVLNNQCKEAFNNSIPLKVSISTRMFVEK